MRPLLAAFRGPEGKTALVAAQASAGVATFLGLAVWSFVRGPAPFDMAGFAAAFGIVLAASAGAIAGHAWGLAKAQAIPAAPDPPVPGPSAAGGAP